MTVGLPADLKKPRKQVDEEAWKPKEWLASDTYAEREAKYVRIEVQDKINAVGQKIKGIIEEAEQGGGDGRPPKIIVFSNFKDSFETLQTMMNHEGIRHTCAAATPVSHFDLRVAQSPLLSIAARPFWPGTSVAALAAGSHQYCTQSHVHAFLQAYNAAWCAGRCSRVATARRRAS